MGLLILLFLTYLFLILLKYVKFNLRVLFANERLVACGHGTLHGTAEVSTGTLWCCNDVTAR